MHKCYLKILSYTNKCNILSSQGLHTLVSNHKIQYMSNTNILLV